MPRMIRRCEEQCVIIGGRQQEMVEDVLCDVFFKRCFESVDCAQKGAGRGGGEVVKRNDAIFIALALKCLLSKWDYDVLRGRE